MQPGGKDWLIESAMAGLFCKVWSAASARSKARWVSGALFVCMPLAGALGGALLGRPLHHFGLDVAKLATACALCAALADWKVSKDSPELAKAQLAALQARIRPHFFFNSITAIVMMMRKDPRKAESALMDLSDIFRATLKDSDDLVALGSEADLAIQYLNIEKLRFGSRLAVETSIDANARGALIPRLLLQPLVENAVVHGVERAKTGKVALRAFVSAGRVNIVVDNDVPCAAERKAANPRVGNGMALENIQARLRLHYGEQSQFQAGMKEGFWRVRLSFPLA